jgi:aspartate kinase
MKLVMKFGGSSLASATKIKTAAKTIQMFSGENRIIVVASAMGDTTDWLIETGELAQRGKTSHALRIFAKIQKLHLRTAQQVSVRGRAHPLIADISELNRELERTVEGMSHLRELTPRTRDYLLSFGERLATPIVAAALRQNGLKARALTGSEAGITTDNSFGEAKPLLEISYHQIRQSLDPIIRKRDIPVVTGFVAASDDGTITTLGRGGSDYTASLLGAGLGVDEIWIWTDVDGLMTADPRIVRDARVLSNVSFGEALELSYFGAKMMHPRALQPAAKNRIPVRVKNSRKPRDDGTLVSSSESRDDSRVVKAVSIIRSVGIVNVSGTGMMGAPGAAARVFQTLGSNKINVMMISQGSSEATISLVVAKKDLEAAVRALQLALLGRGYAENVSSEKDSCIIAVVGAGMRGTPGVAARIFKAVAEKKVNVRMVAQGSSEYNVSFVVSENQGPDAVRAIHEEFELSKTPD